MIQQFAVIVIKIASVILLINVLLFFIKYKRLPIEVKRLAPFLVLIALTEFTSQILFHLGINNLFLLHIYTLLEILTWSYFYFHLFKKNQQLKKWIPPYTLILSIVIIFNTILLEPLDDFNGNAKSLVQLSLIAYAVYYFFISFGRIDLTKAVPRSITFINFAVILYYSGSLFIFMVPQLLRSIGMANTQINALWAINSLLLVVFYSNLLISTWIVAFRKSIS